MVVKFAATIVWQCWVSFIAFFDAGTLAKIWIPVHVCDLTNTLMTGLFIRANVHYPVHWLRLFVVSMVLTMGGSTITALLAGRPPRWLAQPPSFGAAVLGYMLTFHFPGDLFFAVYRQQALRPIFDVLRGIATAHSMSSSAVERAISTPFNATAGVHTYFLLSFLGGAGSALAAEFLNVLLLPPTAFMRPRNGPAPGAITSLISAAAYVAVIRDPGGKLYGALGWPLLSLSRRAKLLQLVPYLEEWLCSSSRATDASSDLCVAVSLPLAHDRQTAIAMLAVLTIALQLRVLGSDAELQDSAAAFFRRILPSFRSVIVPSGIPSPFANSVSSFFTSPDSGGLVASAPRALTSSAVRIGSATASDVTEDTFQRSGGSPSKSNEEQRGDRLSRPSSQSKVDSHAHTARERRRRVVQSNAVKAGESDHGRSVADARVLSPPAPESPLEDDDSGLAPASDRFGSSDSSMVVGVDRISDRREEVCVASDIGVRSLTDQGTRMHSSQQAVSLRPMPAPLAEDLLERLAKTTPADLGVFGYVRSDVPLPPAASSDRH